MAEEEKKLEEQAGKANGGENKLTDEELEQVSGGVSPGLVAAIAHAFGDL